MIRIAKKKAVLSQGEPHDVAVNFDAYRILQRHRAVSLTQHGFLVYGTSLFQLNIQSTVVSKVSK